MATLENLPVDAPRLARIFVFPIKSFSGIEVGEAKLCANGALENDRRWALVDAEGKFVNAKRTARIHLLQATFTADLASVALSAAGQSPQTFSLTSERGRLESFCSTFFSLAIRVVERDEGGFPDDTEAPGPTVISTPTLATIASWFPGLTLEGVRQRFRANLELDVAEPFWEDRLYGPAGSAVGFRIGEVTFAGTNPCQRCVVPSRDPATGEVYPRFAPEFSHRRERTLPPWAEASRFNHFYRLAVNTRGIDCLPSSRIQVGDRVIVRG